MKFVFEIKKELSELCRKYPVAYIEGSLKIIIASKVFLDEDDFLLLEFGIAIKMFLKDIATMNNLSFTYESMDFEEPVITIAPIKEDVYLFDSIFRKTPEKQAISGTDILYAFNDYLKKLDLSLKQNFNIGLHEFETYTLGKA